MAKNRIRGLSPVLIALIHFYQRWGSPIWGGQCRFEPTCSAYAEGVLREHGFFRGLPLILWRLARCNPWSEGGEDPVPSGRAGGIPDRG